jgi:hypothetical protein
MTILEQAPRALVELELVDAVEAEVAHEGMAVARREGA